MDPICFSSKTVEFAWLSNFHAAPFDLEGARWPTVEHWFQAQKFPTDPALAERIRAAATPASAKRLGRTKTPAFRTDWDAVKEEILYRGLQAKFTQHPELRTSLLATTGRPLIEHSPWDSYWGSGRTGQGKNRMGALLERLRAELA